MASTNLVSDSNATQDDLLMRCGDIGRELGFNIVAIFK